MEGEKKMAEEKRNEKSIDDLLDISNLIDRGCFELALLAIDQKEIVEKDSLYTGVALGLAKELDIAENAKMSQPHYTKMVQSLMEYCIDKSKYLKANKG